MIGTLAAWCVRGVGPATYSDRYIVQSLPALLVGIATVVLFATKTVQLFQVHVLHKLPWGSLARFSVTDTCVGIVVMGLFVLYFGGCPACGFLPSFFPTCVPSELPSLPSSVSCHVSPRALAPSTPCVATWLRASRKAVCFSQLPDQNVYANRQAAHVHCAATICGSALLSSVRHLSVVWRP